MWKRLSLLFHVTLSSPVAYLALQDLTKVFHQRRGIFSGAGEEIRAVDGVSLTIRRGEILGLVGEPGCGKPTLSRLIMHLLPPTSGTIHLDGQNLSQLDPEELREVRSDFQMIFQDPYASLNPRMTVFTTLAEAVSQKHADWNPSRTSERITELMEQVGLAPRYLRKYPHEFSGGQRQRIAIARALAPEPRLILADEPVSALDVSIQSQILNLLGQLRDELELTMIFISHDLSVVRYIADRIAVMEEGKIVEVGEADAVFDSPQSETTKLLLSAIPQIR